MIHVYIYSMFIDLESSWIDIYTVYILIEVVVHSLVYISCCFVSIVFVYDGGISWLKLKQLFDGMDLKFWMALKSLINFNVVC